ncbi:MAG: hypothetical protein ABIJ95_05175, partial [Pseudomonadota bacterium]
MSSLVAGVGEKDPFAQAGGMTVDEGIDGLKPEIGHPRPVDVRIGKADCHGLPPDLPDAPVFTGEKIEA